MRFALLLLLIIGVIVFEVRALAVPPGKTVEFDGGPPGKVVFDGKIHYDKGLKCIDCHMKIFQMKKNKTPLKMADINAGKYCGTCHNGEKAFKSSDISNCKQCHKK
jgi:c(7)-type cytochrome triheme protein